jgi:hypothetical protein
METCPSQARMVLMSTPDRSKWTAVVAHMRALYALPVGAQNGRSSFSSSAAPVAPAAPFVFGPKLT